MKNIYYDVVDDFVNNLQKKLEKNIEIDKKEKIMKIENEVIRYEEKDIVTGNDVPKKINWKSY